MLRNCSNRTIGDVRRLPSTPVMTTFCRASMTLARVLYVPRLDVSVPSRAPSLLKKVVDTTRNSARVFSSKK